MGGGKGVADSFSRSTLYYRAEEEIEKHATIYREGKERAGKTPKEKKGR